MWREWDETQTFDQHLHVRDDITLDSALKHVLLFITKSIKVEQLDLLHDGALTTLTSAKKQ